MPSLVRTRPAVALALFAIAVAAGCGAGGAGAAAVVSVAPPIVAALDTAGLPGSVRGRVLLGELGCVACHQPADASFDPVAGPDLRTLAARVRPDYVREFLRAPHAREPGTVMPDLLARWQGAEREQRAEALVHYLLASAAPQPASVGTATPEAEAAAAQERGRALYARIGCRTCHQEEEAPAHLRDKYPLGALQAFLLAPHEARPSQRMPDFGLSPQEAHDLACYLTGPGGRQPVAEFTPQPELVARGRALFGELGCASCHQLPDPQRTDAPAPRALAALDPGRGCLSGTAGAWPHYPLSAAQRQDLQQVLASPAATPPDEEQAQELLASRRCYACHRRGAVDAVTAHAGRLFGTDDASLGSEGQLPPTLDGVGARLQPAWLRRAVASGQRERPYLHVRMPGFGDRFAARLATALARVDVLPPIVVTPLPEGHEPAKPVLELGRELVGDKGMNCIACHRFAGEQAGSMGAIDLVHTTGERLRPEWFAHFLRDPFRFKPNTLMPHFFPGGRSTRPQFADGDVQRQVDALWHYLAEGRNVRRPDGLRQPAIELEVGAEAVLLRRAVQGTGKRGIAVGLPGGVNATFDAEGLGLNQIWWGGFVDARAVWTAQGSGQARILAKEIHALPAGPAFAVLAADDAPWPATTRRERGDRWLGYTLDQGRRPSFRYTVGEVAVEDALHEVPGEGGDVQLRRTLTFAGPPQRLTGRLAVHQTLQRVDEQTVQVGPALRIRCADAPFAVQAIAGQPEQELRFAIAVTPQPVVVRIEYSLRREPK